MELSCINFRTDIAVESLTDINSLPKGAVYKRDVSSSGYCIERLSVDRYAARKIGKPQGNYFTIDCGRPWELDGVPFSALADDIAGELRVLAEQLTNKRLDGNFSVLVAGLGNVNMTPDALGPGTVLRLNATNHLADLDPDLFEKLSCCKLSAFAPGVLGQTGIETVKLIKSAVNAFSPDLLIAVDALAARSCVRLATTVQIADNGIAPGSGVGNSRAALNRESIGIPVIALGAPTVVDSSTLVRDALEKAGITAISKPLNSVLENGKSYFVAPRECDIIVKSLCRLFALSVNSAFGINTDDIS